MSLRLLVEKAVVLFGTTAVKVKSPLSFQSHPKYFTTTFPLRMTISTKRALVIIATGSEEIEAVTPIDVLRRAGVEVSVAGLEDDGPVKCSRNVVLVPDGSLKDFVGERKAVYDLIILPGGLKGAEAFANSPEIGKLLKEQEQNGRLIGAICAAPTALKAHGIGPGKQITSYPSVKDQMTTGTDYNYQESRVVVDGNLITSRGPGTAMEFALTLTEILVGKDKATEVGKGMLFDGSK